MALKRTISLKTLLAERDARTPRSDPLVEQDVPVQVVQNPWTLPQPRLAKTRFPIQNVPPAGTQQTAAVDSKPRVPVAPLDPHHYARIIDGNFTVPANTAASAKLIDQPPYYRNMLMLRNTDTVNSVLVGFGRAASAVSTLVLVPGQLVLFDVVVPQDEVWVLSGGAAAASVSVAYSNINPQ